MVGSMTCRRLRFLRSSSVSDLNRLRDLFLTSQKFQLKPVLQSL